MNVLKWLYWCPGPYSKRLGMHRGILSPFVSLFVLTPCDAILVHAASLLHHAAMHDLTEGRDAIPRLDYNKTPQY